MYPRFKKKDFDDIGVKRGTGSDPLYWSGGECQCPTTLEGRGLKEPC